MEQTEHHHNTSTHASTTLLRVTLWWEQPVSPSPLIYITAIRCIVHIYRTVYALTTHRDIHTYTFNQWPLQHWIQGPPLHPHTHTHTHTHTPFPPPPHFQQVWTRMWNRSFHGGHDSVEGVWREQRWWGVTWPAMAEGVAGAVCSLVAGRLYQGAVYIYNVLYAHVSWELCSCDGLLVERFAHVTDYWLRALHMPSSQGLFVFRGSLYIYTYLHSNAIGRRH